MRWLSLIAVLSGCTLITDPKSYEGDPVDAGVDAIDVDTGDDATVDGGTCSVDLEALTACDGDMVVQCDEDGDRFLRDDEPACDALDAMRGNPPRDCDDANRDRRHGLVTSCPPDSPFVSCVGEIGGVLGGNDAGEVVFELGALTGGPTPERHPDGLTFVARGFGAYDVYYLTDCAAEFACSEMHKIQLSYQPPWDIDAIDIQVMRPAGAPMDTTYYGLSAAREDGIVLLGAVMKAEASDGRFIGLYEGEYSRPPAHAFTAQALPHTTLSRFTDESQIFWLEREDDSTTVLHADRGDAMRIGIRPTPMLSPMMGHPMDASHGYVLLLGNAGSQQFWAAPPLFDLFELPVGGVCSSESGCPPVGVGGSDLDADLGLSPNGMPAVVEVTNPSDDVVGIGVFPVLDGGDREIAVQHLKPGCQVVAGNCTNPIVLDGLERPSGGGPTVLDAVAAGGDVLIVYSHGNEVFLARLNGVEVTTGDTATVTDNRRLFNFGDPAPFDVIHSIDLAISRDGAKLELGVLVHGEVAGRPGLWLDIVRLCGGLPPG